jgi:predicted nucleic acid-binding Zn ribbon protein
MRHDAKQAAESVETPLRDDLRGKGESPPVRSCAACSSALGGSRKDKRFCTPACRRRAWQKQRDVKLVRDLLAELVEETARRLPIKGGAVGCTHKNTIKEDLMNERILELVSRWEKMARRKWTDSEKEKDPMGKRLIEQGAMCYQNCALELNQALGIVSPGSSAIQEADRKL